MRLFEAIVEANRRAVNGDAQACLHPGEFADALPVIALTCIDPRLNPLLPNVLGLAAEDFIWLRNAGNVITGAMSSTLRSLALACAVKGGREIAIIGHTDCRVGRMTVMELIERFKKLGIDRSRLPENPAAFFGMFASERQNVMTAAEFVRRSPIIGAKVPVHGLLVDIQSGAVEWLVNGYETPRVSTDMPEPAPAALANLAGPSAPARFDIGEMKFPDVKLGEFSVNSDKWLAEMHAVPAPPPAPAPPVLDKSAPGKPLMVKMPDMPWASSVKPLPRPIKPKPPLLGQLQKPKR